MRFKRRGPSDERILRPTVPRRVRLPISSELGGLRRRIAPDKAPTDLPWLVFFQGGPGFGSPRPIDATLPGWIGRATKDYRVLLLDQRGTGRSSPISYQSLARFHSPQEQADYLKLFRADNIVRDAEWIRREIGIDRWSVLGQSFGGFCVTTYLSIAPDGLREAFITGGLPPIDHHVDDVYCATFQRVRAKNRLYFERCPDDALRVRDIVDYLLMHDVRLPCGDPLTPRQVFIGLGLGLVNATVLGYALARSPLLDRLLSPYIVASQSVPVVAIAPLLIIWFGSGQLSKILICALIVFFPVLVNTVVGIRSVEKDLRDLMRSLGADRWQTFRLIEVPAALPVLFGGLKIGVTLSVFGAVVGEFVGSDRGLGFLINQARGLFNTPLVFVAIFALVFIAVALYSAVILLEMWLLRWRY